MDHAQYGKTEVEKRRMFEGQLHGAFRSLGLFSSVLVVGVLVLALSANVRAQTKNIFQMTQEERNAYFAKMNTASEEDWQRTVDLLHMKLPPSLPPVAEDPNQPKGTFPMKGPPIGQTAQATPIRAPRGEHGTTTTNPKQIHFRTCLIL